LNPRGSLEPIEQPGAEGLLADGLGQRVNAREEAPAGTGPPQPGGVLQNRFPAGTLDAGQVRKVSGDRLDPGINLRLAPSGRLETRR
jgi:hypothetical protein